MKFELIGLRIIFRHFRD